LSIGDIDGDENKIDDSLENPMWGWVCIDKGGYI